MILRLLRKLGFFQVQKPKYDLHQWMLEAEAEERFSIEMGQH